MNSPKVRSISRELTALFYVFLAALVAAAALGRACSSERAERLAKAATTSQDARR